MSAHLSAWSIITAHLAVLSDRESGEHATARLLKLYNPSLGHRVMAQRVPAGLQLLVAAASPVNPPPLHNMSVKCWEIILAGAFSHLCSAHTYVNWTFPLGSVCNSKSFPVLCRAVNQCNPGDACSSQLAGRTTYNRTPLQHRTPMGRSQSTSSPASCVSSPAGALIRLPLPSWH